MSTHIHIFPNAVIYKGRDNEVDSILMPIVQARALRLETLVDDYHRETPYKIRATNEDGSYFFAEYPTREQRKKDMDSLFDVLADREKKELLKELNLPAKYLKLD